MFTGIIQGLGRIDSIDMDADGAHLEVDIQPLAEQIIALGDSIAVNGVCLTVVRYANGVARFDVSNESLDKTCIREWRAGDEVNLETALTLQTPLGGHIVTGHVDGIGEVVEREPAGDATRLVFSVPAGLGRYIAQKGSVTIDGVSLTTNQILEDTEQGTTFAVMLVPHTLDVTALKMLQPGTRVHVEIDVIARYLARMQSYDEKITKA